MYNCQEQKLSFKEWFLWEVLAISREDKWFKRDDPFRCSHCGQFFGNPLDHTRTNQKLPLVCPNCKGRLCICCWDDLPGGWSGGDPRPTTRYYYNRMFKGW